MTSTRTISQYNTHINLEACADAAKSELRSCVNVFARTQHKAIKTDDIHVRGRSQSRERPQHCALFQNTHLDSQATTATLSAIQTATTESMHLNRRNHRCFSPIFDAPATGTSNQSERRGRSLSREFVEPSARARSPSPSWSRIGWAMGPRDRKQGRSSILDSSLDRLYTKISPLKESATTAASPRRCRRHSIAESTILPIVAAHGDSRGGGGFDTLLQALRI